MQKNASQIILLILFFIGWIIRIILIAKRNQRFYNTISMNLSKADKYFDALKLVLEVPFRYSNQTFSGADDIEFELAKILNLNQMYLSQETFDILRGMAVLLSNYYKNKII